MKLLQKFIFKIIILFLIIIGITEGKYSKFVTFAKNIRNVNTDLKNFLEDIRNRMCHPISKLKLPPLDTFTIENYQHNLTGGELGNLDFLAKKIEAVGLSDFIVKDLHLYFLNPSIVIDIYVPKEIINIDYKLNGTIAELFQINAESDMNFKFEKIGFRFEAKILVAKNLRISVQKLEPYINKFDLRINNLFPDEEVNDFINQMIKDLAPEIIIDYWKAKKPELILYIEKVVADLLKGYSILDISRLIKNLKKFFDENDPEPNCKSKRL
ncbi:uncharacterized protein LOC129613057 [Condylostylus longicornis]|uniref:uncharacterized protein LOC129613057 n=1 Tax=Condylostylus longicornis TaxID=2530218 RepID=UPI00244DA80C|nr:uncharacterized protein LOC129613057 [Condylostylus longicornis]